MKGLAQESPGWLDAYHSRELRGRRSATYGRKLRRLGLAHQAAGLRTLDIACGSGEALALLAGQEGGRLFGVDLHAPARPAAEPFHRVLGDGACLPFRDGSFDQVLCMHSLHHFRSFARIEDLLREARRVLRKQGLLFLLDHFDSLYLRLIFRALATPCLRHFPPARNWNSQLREEHDLICWWLANWQTLFQILENAGFQVRRFRKGLFFFYMVCSPAESR